MDVNFSIVLDTPCWNCGGSDRTGHQINTKGQCVTCNGAGRITTDEGDKLLAFFRRHRPWETA